MPAAAVIPAPIAYIKIVAVKKLVVGFLVLRVWPPATSGACRYSLTILLGRVSHHFNVFGSRNQIFYFERIRVFKAGLRCEYISME